MVELFVHVDDLPVEGREFSFAEQRIWADPIAEFRLPWSLATPLTARLSAHPQPQGVLISGNLQGSLVMPCARCAEDYEHSVDEYFLEFEAFPGTGPAAQDAWWIVSRDGLLFLDMAGFLWEQLHLSLPLKALCRPMCRGVCTACGANKNVTACTCAPHVPDPRWNALRAVQASMTSGRSLKAQTSKPFR